MFRWHLDRTSPLSLPQQLTRAVRDQILDGRLPPGEALPPSRLLAGELAVARNVVVQAYEQLLAEGYLTSRVGAGTFVAELPVARAGARARPGLAPARAPRAGLAPRISFNPGLPDLGRFPRRLWAKSLKAVCLEARPGAFGYGPVQGERALREALVGYLWRGKGIECRADQLVIVAGAAQGVDLLAHLRGPGGTALVEDPGYDHVRQILARNGFELVAIPVDRHGLRTDALPAKKKGALVYVVPSHQFPLGGVLPAQRRLVLLQYARRSGALVVEDDYDSEFRYSGGPIQSLRDLAPDLVVYLGTFSKILSPGLRLGFMILPDHLLAAACRLKEELNLRTPPLEQLALARFIEDRSLDRHVFKMKKLYRSKRAHLVGALSRTFGDRVRIGGEEAGLHVLVELVGRSLRPADLARLEEQGVKVDWVEDYAWHKGRHRHQLVLGYGGLAPEQIEAGVRLLGATLGER